MEIRNFVIIAHIDSGKSTLADRLLEMTHTVEARRMKPQYLDRLELERERGITIKMAPVRMVCHAEAEYILNLIDTPGHSDFSYEVSRALAAVEGAILLVDATKGIQAQTLSNFRAAADANLSIIGAVNKVDLAPPRLEGVVHSLAKLLGVDHRDIFKISAKTGEGITELIGAVIEKIPPPPKQKEQRLVSLIFDSLYGEHKGILAFTRVFSGSVRAGDEIELVARGTKAKVKEVGVFTPEFKRVDSLVEGTIGYIATGLKESNMIKIGDTITKCDAKHSEPRITPLTGYREPSPVVFISFYPDGNTKFEDLEKGFARLHLNDSALAIEPDANEALGRGLKIGFLGQLHFEITASRLKDEFGLEFLTSFPSVAYRVRVNGTEFVVKQPSDFPDRPDEVFQPMIQLQILAPSNQLNVLMGLSKTFDVEVETIENVGGNVLLKAVMPLAELLHDFDDRLKSVSQGFASFSYEIGGERKANVVKLEILIAGEVVSALTRIVPEKTLEREARLTVERLKRLLPRQQFAQAVQARAHNRIIARETIPALKKDVTGYLYGGDRTRKMKLWKKQKRGKERLKSVGRVNLSVEVFREILKK